MALSDVLMDYSVLRQVPKFTELSLMNKSGSSIIDVGLDEGKDFDLLSCVYTSLNIFAETLLGSSLRKIALNDGSFINFFYLDNDVVLRINYKLPGFSVSNESFDASLIEYEENQTYASLINTIKFIDNVPIKQLSFCNGESFCINRVGSNYFLERVVEQSSIEDELSELIKLEVFKQLSSKRGIINVFNKTGSLPNCFTVLKPVLNSLISSQSISELYPRAVIAYSMKNILNYGIDSLSVKAMNVLSVINSCNDSLIEYRVSEVYSMLEQMVSGN